MDLYYALWAHLAGLPLFLRATLVVKIFSPLYIISGACRTANFILLYADYDLDYSSAFSSGFESVPYKGQ